MTRVAITPHGTVSVGPAWPEHVDCWPRERVMVILPRVMADTGVLAVTERANMYRYRAGRVRGAKTTAEGRRIVVREYVERVV